ncbi:pentapeptide repeat-containing protein [Amycolatopsis sp. NPDC059090]|uniref:pentapeptide repeat-containing protein n=1 Tax=unclassified Amycolatopsis TaxID=2618356 RepID=UPI00366A9CFE
MDEDSSEPRGQRPIETLTGVGRRPRLQELTPKAMWATVAAITVLTAGAVVSLWWAATRGLTGAALVTARFDALKIGLSIGVGSGGIVALYLAWRRQRSTEADLDNRERALAHQRDVSNDVRADATARRITELYTKAVEQLGSDKGPVRLGGLYALERLAQDNAEQRQTIVNVLCAYLRMPYQPLAAPPNDDHDAVDANLLQQYREQLQEREVRITAQRILEEHVKPARDEAYWGERDLDLAGAYLYNVALTSIRVGEVRFDGATFAGDAKFGDANFTRTAKFGDATFTRTAWFSNATFSGDAKFGYATFTRNAWFGGAVFARNAWFGRAVFESDAKFGGAIFAGEAKFGGATFHGDAKFGGVTFEGDAWFNGTTFTNSAKFGGVTFARRFKFDEATLKGSPFEFVKREGTSERDTDDGGNV